MYKTVVGKRVRKGKFKKVKKYWNRKQGNHPSHLHLPQVIFFHYRVSENLVSVSEGTELRHVKRINYATDLQSQKVLKKLTEREKHVRPLICKMHKDLQYLEWVDVRDQPIIE